MATTVNTYVDKIIASQSDSHIIVGSNAIGTSNSLCILPTTITQYDTDGSYVEFSASGIKSLSSTFDISGNLTFAGTGNTSSSNGWVLTSNGVGAPTFQEFVSYADLDQVCNSVMSTTPNYTTQSLNVVDNISTPTYHTSISDFKIDISQNSGGYQNQAVITTTINNTSPGLFFNSSTDGAQVGQITLDTNTYLMMEGANSSTAIQITPSNFIMNSYDASGSNSVNLGSNIGSPDSPNLLFTHIDSSGTYTLSMASKKYEFIRATDYLDNFIAISSNYIRFSGVSGEVSSLKVDSGNSILDLSGSNPDIKIQGKSGTTGQVITYNGSNIAWQNTPFYYYLDLSGSPTNNGNINWTVINSSLNSLTNIPFVVMTADSGNNSITIQVSSSGSTTTQLFWASSSNIISLSILVYSRG